MEGCQAVYKLVQVHFLHIDNSKKPVIMNKDTFSEWMEVAE